MTRQSACGSTSAIKRSDTPDCTPRISRWLTRPPVSCLSTGGKFWTQGRQGLLKIMLYFILYTVYFIRQGLLKVVPVVASSPTAVAYKTSMTAPTIMTTLDEWSEIK